MPVILRLVILGLLSFPIVRGATLELDGKLVQATATPEVREVAPYPRALCTYLYEVQKVHAGSYDGERILVVKWAVWERAKVEGLPEVGAVERLKLDRWIDHEKLRSQRIVDTIRETDLVIYYDVESMPPGPGSITIGREHELDRGVVKGAVPGWLFLAEELVHAETGKFWEKDWADVSRAGVDPLPAMLDFQKRLGALGVRLLVVPVPTKVGIYPECLERGVEVVSLSGYLEHLRRAGLNVLDLEPVFAAARRRSPLHPLYCRQDSHWSPAACDVAALEIKKRLGLPEVELTLPVAIEEAVTTTIRGDLARMLDDPTVLPERVRHNRLQFKGARTALGMNHPMSPVVLLGDSNLTIFSEGTEEMHGAGAGLPDHLFLQLGYPADVIASHGDGVDQARVNLYQERTLNPATPDYWKHKRWVVWVFASREFTRADRWSTKIPVAPPQTP